MLISIRYTGIESIDKLYEADITGNLIPSTWCHKITGSNGKPNMNAIMILAEILYWHRPKVEYVKGDPENIHLLKRFKADLLQLSYGKLEQKFNLTKDQCRRALDLLEDQGLIKRHFRTVTIGDGRRLNNVMYIELITDKLLSMTHDGQHDPYMIKPTSSYDESDEVSVNNESARISKQMTNTKNTTEIINKDHLSIYHNEQDKVRKQVDYNCLIIDKKKDRGMIDNIIDLISETNLSNKTSHMINGAPVPSALVKDRLSRIDIDIMKAVLDRIKAINTPVVNVNAYLLSTLYNAPVTFETDLDMKVRYDMYGNEARI